MTKSLKIPQVTWWSAAIFLIVLFFMTLFRLAFYYYFKNSAEAFSDYADAFLLGLRYDMRTAGIIVLPLFLISLLHVKYSSSNKLSRGSIFRLAFTGVTMVVLLLVIKNNKMPVIAFICALMIFVLIFVWLFKAKNCNPFQNIISKKVWRVYLIVIISLLIFLYGLDIQHYDYLHQRLNASILNYTEDAKISFGMVWETYPVLKILLTIAFLSILLIWLIFSAFKSISGFNNKSGSITAPVIFFLLISVAVFGRLGQYPLRWSDAFAFGNDFKANLALNPVQSFFSTLQFRHAEFDEKQVKKYYSLLASYLGIQKPDTTELNYKRTIYPAGNSLKTPNIVLVICESFSGYKSSMWGNPLNTTPYFKSLCDNGVFFDHCFTPAYGTARGVWAVLTGIPDVESPRTASRNPAAVDQHTIINDFKGYDKFYFLGGSTSWANIRALLTFNITGLRLYEDGSYKAHAVDVWGISDKHLFLEANDVLKKQQAPFFAVIQTADNHRPYTIPDEDLSEFHLQKFSKDSLNNFGFENNEELNAFRYTDFCFQKFVEAAKKETYFNNTIFIFVGDHGIPGHTGNMFPACWENEVITSYHVPLLFYAPALLQAKRISSTCSQLDILPSVVSLVNYPAVNTTMGRNLFDTSTNSLRFNNRAFLFNPDGKKIGMMTDEYCYMKELLTGKEDFVSAKNNDKLPADSQTASDKKIIRDLTNGYYETGKYLLLNNKKFKSNPGK
jgi:phosphoglycerol transferase MdoB-like AlkP superfamily enzyme